MDMAQLLQQAVSGKVPVDGARVAQFMQMAQFALKCRPDVKVVNARTTRLYDKLQEIHDAGGVLVSVFKEDNFTYMIVCYMPEEKKDGGSSVQH